MQREQLPSMHTYIPFCFICQSTRILTTQNNSQLEITLALRTGKYQRQGKILKYVKMTRELMDTCSAVVI
jgi:hypothetical protein